MRSKRLVVTNMTCQACPSQWDLWADDGTQYYARYRHGRFYISYADADCAMLGELKTGDSLDGYMTTREMFAIIEKMGFKIGPVCKVYDLTNDLYDDHLILIDDWFRIQASA